MKRIRSIFLFAVTAAACSGQPAPTTAVPHARDAADRGTLALRLVWEIKLGPCKPGFTCANRLTLDSDGHGAFYDSTQTLSDTFSQETIAEVVKLFTAPATEQALRGFRTCNMISSPEAEETLVLEVNGAAPVRALLAKAKGPADCDSKLYDTLTDALLRFRTHSFDARRRALKVEPGDTTK